MKERIFGLITIVLIFVSLFAYHSYQRDEDRKAYYACLVLSEKLAEQQKEPKGEVRIVSLPYCRI